jgi:hypothetical protein
MFTRTIIVCMVPGSEVIACTRVPRLHAYPRAHLLCPTTRSCAPAYPLPSGVRRLQTIATLVLGSGSSALQCSADGAVQRRHIAVEWRFLLRLVPKRDVVRCWERSATATTYHVGSLFSLQNTRGSYQTWCWRYSYMAGSARASGSCPPSSLSSGRPSSVAHALCRPRSSRCPTRCVPHTTGLLLDTSTTAIATVRCLSRIVTSIRDEVACVFVG